MIYYGSKRSKKCYYRVNGTTHKVKKAWLGVNGSFQRVFSAGDIVTYYVDSSTVYKEEVETDKSCLSPTTFTPSKSGWTFAGWRKDTTASATVLTSCIMDADPITLYAVFKQNVTVTYYNASTTASTNTQVRYYNNGNYSNPSFTLTQSAISGWTARGWSTGSTGNSGITYSSGVAFSLANTVVSATINGLYQRTLTLTYAANGGSGSMTADTNVQYYSSQTAGYVNPSFILKSCSYTYTNFGFSGWKIGSTTYDAGSSVTLSASTTATAQWVSLITNITATSSVSTYTAPALGDYYLEVYGAKGAYDGGYGSSQGGGYGGYSNGYVSLTKGKIMYICCGTRAGYNGGQVGSDSTGGGATHIATASGVLSSLASNTSAVLIVAGGGGGQGHYGSGAATGGAGGGLTGGSGCTNGDGYSTCCAWRTDIWNAGGGTQTGGGQGGGASIGGHKCDDSWVNGQSWCGSAGSFGQGGGSGSGCSGGGGGGWYGGGGNNTPNGTYTGGGGGSGYIGGVTNGATTAGVCTGQGSAKITLSTASSVKLTALTRDITDLDYWTMEMTTTKCDSTYIASDAGKVAPPNGGGDTGTINLYTLTSTAKSNYAYADVTICGYAYAISGSSAYLYLNGVCIKSGDCSSDQATFQNTYTFSTSAVPTARAVMQSGTWESSWCGCGIMVKDIVLHN